MKFTVDTRDMRAALAAVTPHICTDEQIPSLCRVRVTVDEHTLTVTATDRFTMGMGLVSIIAHDVESAIYGLQLGQFDLPPADVGKIMHLFRVPKDAQSQYLLEVDATHTDRITVTDVSGLVHGDTLEMPRVPIDENMPDLRQSFANWLSRDSAVLEDLMVNGARLAKFKAAAVAYSESLVLRRPERAPLLIQCGDSFLGALASMWFDDATAQTASNHRDAWSRRLPPATGVVDLDETYASTEPTSDTETAEGDQTGDDQ